MEVIPAIDLRQGKCARLRQGDKDRVTIYADDPLAVAQQWRDEGARWLHVVNLDGAFDERDTENLQATARMARSVGIPIQFGGGIRSRAAAERLFDLGVRRIILGTVAVERPALVAELVARFGAEAIVVGIDAKQGKVATHGWQAAGDCAPLELAQRMQAEGVTRIVYTDIARDGMLIGVNVAATAELAQATRLRVIASGGVADLPDLQALAATGVIEGCIVGKALYEGRFTLRAAWQAVGGAILEK
ncbi:MAG: 1-(5-phosphoribosyl)-5-[(5-phosphoribosylamino)methylideneamino]imidazole-4-carboxamide isomerase [Chloracidobacterium sp. CP2_5A]|nr:MAG: 1-(5-phosphoribosyl)-5-[(5-phosphoribosylamino)methylideneamino]imidazole-4-carboxamide isomerase [Chloracidobacterium sp. CP2_5A]